MSILPLLVEQTIGHALALATDRFGDREAYVFADRRLSFRDAELESDTAARALLAAGVRRGHRIAVWMANYAEWVPIYFGALKIGAVLVPLNTRSRPDELAFALNKVKTALLFFKREVKGRTDYGDVLLEVVPELAAAQAGALHSARVPTLRSVVDIASPPMKGTVGFGEFLERGVGISDESLNIAKHEVRPGDDAVIVWTSGTTSAPKGARLSHAGMVHSAYKSCHQLRLTELDTFFSVSPMYHAGGAIGVMLRLLPTGCRMVTRPYFDPTSALDAMETERVTVMTGHQPHFVEYMNHPTLAQRKLFLERGMIFGPPEIYWQVYEKMGIEGLVNGLGMTETHVVGCASTLDDSREVRFNTNGRPFEGVSVEIRDPEDGTVLGPEQEGEIFLRVPYPMLGYFDEPQLTADVLDTQGWYRTGDRGVIRKDGNLVLLGRVRDMIRVGGENLAGAEVEAVLLQHPAVKQAAAIAGPDARLGEIVIAFVETKPGSVITADELIAYCGEKLARYKVPRAVHFVTEWPMAGSGKIQRRLLLDIVAP